MWEWCPTMILSFFLRYCYSPIKCSIHVTTSLTHIMAFWKPTKNGTTRSKRNGGTDKRVKSAGRTAKQQSAAARRRNK